MIAICNRSHKHHQHYRQSEDFEILVTCVGIEVALVINLSVASSRVTAGLFMTEG